MRKVKYGPKDKLGFFNGFTREEEELHAIIEHGATGKILLIPYCDFHFVNPGCDW